MILIGWDTLQIGLAYGTALLVGAFLGETAGGWVVDYIMVSFLLEPSANIIEIPPAIIESSSTKSRPFST